MTEAAPQQPRPFPVSSPHSHPMNDQRLSNDVFHAKARIERRERILKNNLQIAAQPAHVPAASRQQVAPFKANRSRSRLNQSQNQSSQRALARARLANQSQRLAGLNVERNLIHSSDFTAGFPPERRFAMRINFRQIANLDEGHAADVSREQKSTATDSRGFNGGRNLSLSVAQNQPSLSVSQSVLIRANPWPGFILPRSAAPPPAPLATPRTSSG